MSKTGIHVKRCNVGSVEDHNERKKNYLKKLKELGYNLYFFQELTRFNRSWVNKRYADKTVAQHFRDMCARYKEKTGQAPQLQDRERIDKKSGKKKIIAGWSPIREGCPPIKKDTQIKDFAPFVEWLRSHGLDVIRIDLHHDEGYEDEDGIRKMNHHAHIVIDWTDHITGKTIKLDKKDMEEMQTVLADSLGMERGTPKADTGLIHEGHAEFREKKAANHLKKLLSKCDNISEQIEELEEQLVQQQSQNQSTIDEATKLQDRIKQYEDAIKKLKEEAERRIALLNKKEKEAAYYDKLDEIVRKKINDALAHLNALEKTQKSIKAATEAVNGLKSKFFGSDSKRFDALQEELYKAKKESAEWQTVAIHEQHTQGQGDLIKRQQERIRDLERKLDKAAPGWRMAERAEHMKNTLNIDIDLGDILPSTRQQQNTRTRSEDQGQGYRPKR